MVVINDHPWTSRCWAGLANYLASAGVPPFPSLDYSYLRPNKLHVNSTGISRNGKKLPQIIYRPQWTSGKYHIHNSCIAQTTLKIWSVIKQCTLKYCGVVAESAGSFSAQVASWLTVNHTTPLSFRYELSESLLYHTARVTQIINYSTPLFTVPD